ncbi:MAG: signal peptidase I [Acidimicrobiales bacterium]
MTDAREASIDAGNLAEPSAPLVPDFPTAATGGSQVPTTEPVERTVDVPGPSSSRSRRNPNQKRRIVEWMVIVAFAVLVAGGLRTFVVQAFYVPSGSMLPTLQIGDRIVVIKLGYTVHRGDIVVFKRPPKDVGTQDKDLVKRVIGMPGETISSRGNTVLINGRPLAEPWLPRLTGLCTEAAENIPLTKIAPGHYFVMGDCRGDSADSRVWGTLPGSLVVGRVFVIVWRFGHPYFHWF